MFAVQITVVQDQRAAQAQSAVANQASAEPNQQPARRATARAHVRNAAIMNHRQSE